MTGRRQADDDRQPGGPGLVSAGRRSAAASAARDVQAVRKALDGSDAVISTLPGGNRRDPHLTADITAAIITAMADVDVRRLVVTNAYPIVADRPRPAVTLLRC